MTIDANTLSELGIELGESSDEFLQHINDQLDERVGAALLELLDDTEAEEFMSISEKGDDDATEAWIAAHIPDYADVVQDEVDILLGELASSNQ